MDDHPGTVLTFGESMLLFAADTAGDLATAGRFTRRLCGADSNVAIGLARLGFAVSYLSRVGDDAFGRYVRATLATEGVATDAIQCDPARPTGVMFKSRRDDGGDPQTQYYRAGSAASALAPGDLDRVAHHRLRHLHVSGISAALGASVLALCHHAIDRARAQGATVSFDPNLRPALWPDPARMRTQIDALAARCDWLLIGIGEAEQLIDSRDIETIAAHYLGLGSGEVVIKLGADGAALRSRDARFDAAPLAVAQVVDTVGAGDAFACGFISARLDGLDARGALARGNAFGARAVQHPGDYESLPRRDELTADLH